MSTRDVDRIAVLSAACEKFRAVVANVDFEITSQESRVATTVHELGVSIGEVTKLERRAKQIVGETSIDPISQHSPVAASHLQNRCYFLMIAGMKAIVGTEMITAEDSSRCCSCTRSEQSLTR